MHLRDRLPCLGLLASLTPACVIAGPDAGDDGAADTDDASSGAATSGDGDASADASADSSGGDPSGDPSGGPGGDPSSGDPSGADTDGDDSTIDDDTFFFVRRVGDGYDDELWAYDLATDQASRVTDLGGMVSIKSIAIAPDRSAVAIASDYQRVDYQASEAIWRFDAHAGAIGGEPTLLMPPIPTPIGVSTGYSQQIDDLQWHPDGSALWFGHGFFFDIGEPGGGAIGRVDAATGEFELFIDAIADCTVNTSPSPSPDASVLLAVRAVCIDSAHEGLIGSAAVPAADAQVIVPSSNLVFATPRWLADGSGVLFAGSIDYDGDGDGTAESFGSALLLLDTNTGDQYVVMPPTPDQYVWSFAMAPDEARFVVCLNSDAGRNLLLVDLSGEQATSRWLTDDGASCYPAW